MQEILLLVEEKKIMLHNIQLKPYYLPILIVVGCLVFILNLDALYINIMEARNFITAREMLTHNNWIFTTIDLMPRYEKPPLPTWLTAISASIFGIKNVFAYRLPAALVSIFMVIMFYKLQLKLNIKKYTAFLGSLILMTSFYIVFSGRDGQWDIFTHSFMVTCCYFFIKMIALEKHQYQNALLAGIFFGASLLSKGPVSLYALFLPFFVAYAITYKFKTSPTLWKSISLFIIVGLISGTWWTAIAHYYDPEAFAEVANTESTRWFSYNVRPIWYYWSFFTQSGIWTIPALMSLFYWYLKPRVSNFKAYRFYFLWTICSVILLSIIPEKKSRYLLPVLIPLAMATSFYVEYAIRNFKDNFSKLEKIPIWLNFGVLTLVSFALPFLLYFGLKETIWEMKYQYLLFSIFLIALGILFVYGIYKTNMKLLFSLQVLMIVGILSFGFPLSKLIAPERNSPNVAQIRSYIEENDLNMYDVSGLFPELIFTYGKPIPLSIEEYGDDLPSEKEFGIFVNEESTPEWRSRFEKYQLRFVDTLNLNPAISKGKNVRLIRHFYIATKKKD